MAEDTWPSSAAMEAHEALTLIRSHVTDCDRRERAMNQRFDRTDTEIHEVKRDVHGLRDEMRAGFRDLHTRISENQKANHAARLREAERDGASKVRTGIYRGMFIVGAGSIGAGLTAFGKKLLILIGTIIP
ncbi:MAG: hypothetical protein RIE31_05150 [Alphaproteobacteria bacterium]